MKRFIVYHADGTTFQVVDQVEQREICVCADYDDWEDARERAEKIAALLNEEVGTSSYAASSTIR